MLAVRLDNISRETKGIGRKASNLGELIKLGLNVPEGFVLTSEAFELFLKENKLEIDDFMSQIDYNDVASIKNASSEIQNVILNGTVPKKVETAVKEAYEELSVGKEVKKVGGLALDLVKAGRETVVCLRPSPLVEDSFSFPGLMRAEMNIKGWGRIVNNLKKVWASLYTPGAIFYRKEKGLEEPTTAVIVQRMVNSEKSGVIFTVEPAENDRSKVVIEAGFGLGDPVVSGLIRPDAYIVEKSRGEVVSKTISKKLWEKKVDRSTGNVIMGRLPESRMNSPTLSDSDIKGIVDAARKVEEHFNFPQNMEWCRERGRLYVVQTRPVTGLESREEAPALDSYTGGDSVIKGTHAFPSRASGTVKLISGQTDLEEVGPDSILMAKFFSLELVPYLTRVRAVITDEGGITSVPSILAREFGVPLVFGTASGVSVLKSGQGISIGPDGGVTVTRPVAEEKAPEETEAQGMADLPLPAQPDAENIPAGPALATQPAEPAGGLGQLDERFTATEIMVYLKSSQLEGGFKDTSDGVGILRLESMLKEGGKDPVQLAGETPSELTSLIAEAVGKVARAFQPRPVWYRCLEMEAGEAERNPIVGVRGFRFSYLNPDVFRCEVEALKRLHSSGMKNLGLLLPFVTSIEEFRKAKEAVGFGIKLGISVETPAAAMNIEDFCKEGAAFVLVDLDSLSQLVLGVEKGHPRVSYLYTHTSPAVMELLGKVYSVCKKHGVPVSVCGEKLTDSSVSESVIEAGADSVTVGPEAVEPARLSVAKAERRLLLKRLRG